MDTDIKMRNEKLLKAIADLKVDNTPETRIAYVNSLLEAKFLVPAVFEPKPERDENGKVINQEKIKVHFRVLTTENKEQVFPCFTNDAEFEKGFPEEGIERVLMEYKNLVPLIVGSKGAMSGFAIDPFGVNMPVTAALIEQIEKNRLNAIQNQVKKESVTVKLRTPAYQPIDMMNAATEFFQSHSNVNAAYLQMMEKEDGSDEYLITVDLTGDDKQLFDDLLPLIKDYSFGIPITFTNTKNPLGLKVVENAEPFYQKEVQE